MQVGAFEKATEEDFKRQFQANVFGVMDLTREVIPFFREQGHGTIINISSVGGNFRLRDVAEAVYHAANDKTDT